jgi:hypothetical protein
VLYFPSQCFLKEGISTNSSRDGNQIDQLDTSNFSSLPLGYVMFLKFPGYLAIDQYFVSVIPRRIS